MNQVLNVALGGILKAKIGVGEHCLISVMGKWLISFSVQHCYAMIIAFIYKIYFVVR